MTDDDRPQPDPVTAQIEAEIVFEEKRIAAAKAALTLGPPLDAEDRAMLRQIIGDGRAYIRCLKIQLRRKQAAP